MIGDAVSTGLEGTRCLVTGGAGFIGSNLVRLLLREGARVQVVDNFITGRPENLPAEPRLQIAEGDVRTEPRLDNWVQNADFVFHLAAQVGNIKSIEETEADASTNVLGTVRVLRACRGSKVRGVVYSSSSAIFGEAERLPIDEDHPLRPASFYALSKLTGERYARLAASLWDVPVVCLRYFNVYGLPMENNEYTGVISIFFNSLAARRPITFFGDGGQFRDFVYVKDVARANVLAALRGRPGAVYNIGTGVRTTVRELAAEVGRAVGVTPIVEKRDSRAGEVRESVSDPARARQDLGFETKYDLSRGLSEMWSAMAAGRRHS